MSDDSRQKEVEGATVFDIIENMTAKLQLLSVSRETAGELLQLAHVSEESRSDVMKLQHILSDISCTVVSSTITALEGFNDNDGETEQ